MPEPPTDVPPNLSLFRRLWWAMFWVLCSVWFVLCYRFRVRGRRQRVTDGPVLYASNHQSYFDPIILGIATGPRPFFSMARRTLWETGWLAWLINSLNAIPVDQDAADIRSIRQCVAALKAGHALEIFPEGARTPDGDVHGFSRGTLLLIKQAKPTIVPIAIDGAYDVWPRSAKRPKLFGRIRCTLGRPIAAEDLLAEADPIQTLEDEVRRLHSV